MAQAILIMGKSGSGKSASLRNVKGKWMLINVNKKPLPFKKNENITVVNENDYLKIRSYLQPAYEKGFKSVVLDDCGYLLTDKFMSGHRTKSGSASFDLYNDIADQFYSLIKFVTDSLPQDMIVYIVMHETTNDFGEVKPKSIGKLLDEKVCIEGLFTVVLRAMKHDKNYVFATNSDGLDCTKSPIGMFNDEYIDNDLQVVDETIRNYYL